MGKSQMLIATHKFGWSQGSWKFLKEKTFWLRGLDLN
jgi:hypothetical protein